MTGEEYHKAFKNDPQGRKIDDIIKEMKSSKGTIYPIFKAALVKPKFIKMAVDVGIVFNEVSSGVSEVDFLKTKIKYLESLNEDLRLTNEFYRTLLKNLTESDKKTVEKEIPGLKKQKT